MAQVAQPGLAGEARMFHRGELSDRIRRVTALIPFQFTYSCSFA
jgi:hypothetical protein